MKRIIAVIVLLSMVAGCANINRAITGDLHEYDKHATSGEQIVAAPFILVRLAAGLAIGIVLSPVVVVALVYGSATERQSTAAKVNENIIDTTPLASLSRTQK